MQKGPAELSAEPSIAVTGDQADGIEYAAENVFFA